jgi:hypothetical protein
VTSGGGDDSLSFLNNDSQNFNLNLTNVSVLEKQVAIGTRNATNQYIEDDIGNNTSNALGTNTSQDVYSVGATFNAGGGQVKNAFEGMIYEVIVYSVELTSSQVSQVQNYLKSKWNT